MSGAEALVVLGAISSIIAIVDGTKKVYDAASTAHGLPEAFREVANRLPIITTILTSVRQQLEQEQTDDNLSRGIKPIIEACEKRTRRLNDLFRSAIAEDGSSDVKRYYKAIKTVGKGGEVENLMKGILFDLQLLACEHGIRTTTQIQKEQITKDIEGVSAVTPSVPENVFRETAVIASHSGSSQYITQGENIAQGKARMYISGGAPMHFDFTTTAPATSHAMITSQTLPFATPKFFGRETELRAVEDCLLGHDTRQKFVVLSGIGGLGKTQIALHFWKVHSTLYTSKIWIDGTSLVTVLSSFHEAALALGHSIASKANEIDSTLPLSAVKSWLSRKDNKQWLLVIDNIEDLDGDYSIHDVVPKCDHGAILVTTTLSGTSQVLSARNIEVKAIESEAGGSILRRRFKRKSYTEEEKKLTDEVVRALHGVPLAIEQAGAYLQVYPSLSTVALKSLLAKLSSPSDKAEVLATIPKKSMWFYEKHRSVVDTFNLLKSTITSISSDVLHALIISACLAPGEIPMSFLAQSSAITPMSSTEVRMGAIHKKLGQTPSKALAWLQHITADETLCFQALQTLEQYCCVTLRLSSNETIYRGYSMHNVIRAWCQESMEPAERVEWTILGAFQLSRSLPLDSVSAFGHQNISRQLNYLNTILLEPQHAKFVQYPDGPYWWHAFTIACVGARFFQRQRQFEQAKRLIEVIIGYETMAYGRQGPYQRETLETLHSQARILWDEENFSIAIPKYRDLLAACDATLGHFDDLTIAVSQELSNVQEHLKRQERDWKAASCTPAQDHQVIEEENVISSSSDESPSTMQHFLARYSGDIIPSNLFDTIHVGGSDGGLPQALEGWINRFDYRARGFNIIQENSLQDYIERDRIVQEILTSIGVRVDKKNMDKFMARVVDSDTYYHAIHRGHNVILELLPYWKGEVNDINEAGSTLLITVVSRKYRRATELLLDMGVDINKADKDGNTALILAAREGQYLMVKLLLKNGAKSRIRNNDGINAREAASGAGHEEVARMLKDRARLEVFHL